MNYFTEQQVHLLTLLADHLEKLPPERFDLSRWVGNDWKGHQDLSCGTTACAIGHATAIPEIQAAGLHLYIKCEIPEAGNTRVENRTYGCPVPLTEKVAARLLANPDEGVGIEDTFESITEVFGLKLRDAKALFLPAIRKYPEDGGLFHENASAKEVAAGIRYLLAEGDFVDFTNTLVFSEVYDYDDTGETRDVVIERRGYGSEVYQEDAINERRARAINAEVIT